jgi:hypothetical protein
MAEAIHPGSWLGDSVEEFKKLPTWGKVAVGAAVLGVAAYGIHTYSKNKASSATSATANTPASSSPQTSAAMLPPDSSQPIPYQPNYNVTQSTPTTAPGQGIFATIRSAITNTQAPGYIPNGTGIPIRQTPGGNVIGQEQFGQQAEVIGPAISGPNNFGPNNPNGSDVWYQLAQGGYVSGFDVSNVQSAPKVQAAAPANTTTSTSTGAVGGPMYTVQYGDNMNHVAHLLGLKSWKDFGVSSFWHGQKLSIPQ